MTLSKKLPLVFIIFTLCFGFKASAQGFKGGLYAGLTASQLNGDGISGYDLPGARVGAFTYRDIDKDSKLQLEIAFLQKGSRDTTWYKVRLNYVEVPIVYIYRWKDLSFEIGPAADILVSAKEDFNGFINDNPDPPFKTLSLTGVTGISYHFTDNFYINFRSNISITAVRQPYHPRGYGWRNINLSFALVYDFNS